MWAEQLEFITFTAHSEDEAKEKANKWLCENRGIRVLSATKETFKHYLSADYMHCIHLSYLYKKEISDDESPV